MSDDEFFEIAYATERSRGIMEAFSTLADYIWKTPSFLGAELENEKEKLSTYFPFNGNADNDEQMRRLRNTRFALEFPKLLLDFPVYMAHANFLIAFAHYEDQLSSILDSLSKKEDFADVRKFQKSARKMLGYIERNVDKSDPYNLSEKIKSAIHIRNCLIHANGFVRRVDAPDELEKIIRQRLYLPQRKESAANAQHEKIENEKDYIRIEDTKHGPRIIIDNLYAWRACVLFRNHLLGVVNRVNGDFCSANSE